MQSLLAFPSAVKTLIVFVKKAECTGIWCHSGIMELWLVVRVTLFYDLHLVKFPAALWWTGELPSIEPCLPRRHLESLLVRMCGKAVVWALKALSIDVSVYSACGNNPRWVEYFFLFNVLHTFLKEILINPHVAYLCILLTNEFCSSMMCSSWM